MKSLEREREREPGVKVAIDEAIGEMCEEGGADMEERKGSVGVAPTQMGVGCTSSKSKT